MERNIAKSDVTSPGLGRNQLTRVISAVILVVTVYCSWLSIGTNDFNRHMLAQLLGADAENSHYDYSLKWDVFYAFNFPDGNLFIKFNGLDPEKHKNFILSQYIRASYNLYPRKVYVTTLPVELTDSASILQNNAISSESWLTANGVDSIVTFSLTSNGDQAYTITRTKQPSQ